MRIVTTVEMKVTVFVESKSGIPIHNEACELIQKLIAKKEDYDFDCFEFKIIDEIEESIDN